MGLVPRAPLPSRETPLLPELVAGAAASEDSALRAPSALSQVSDSQVTGRVSPEGDHEFLQCRNR